MMIVINHDRYELIDPEANLYRLYQTIASQAETEPTLEQVCDQLRTWDIIKPADESTQMMAEEVPTYFGWRFIPTPEEMERFIAAVSPYELGELSQLEKEILATGYKTDLMRLYEFTPEDYYTWVGDIIVGTIRTKLDCLTYQAEATS